MKHRPYVPMPWASEPKRRTGSGWRGGLKAAAVVAAVAAAGFGGYALGRRGTAPEALTGAAASPSPTPAAPGAAPGGIAVEPDWKVVDDDALAAMMNGAAAPASASTERADEAVLNLVTFRAFLDDPPPPEPALENVIVDGAAEQVPVQIFPDSTPASQHWGFTVRAHGRAAHHRVAFRDSAKVYEWFGGKWIQTK
jgi:hypothetical protein